MSLHEFDNTNLSLERCPHCSIASPLLAVVHRLKTQTSDGFDYKWNVYTCSRCARPVVGGCEINAPYLSEIYPESQAISEDMPARAAAFLAQAGESLHAPSGAVMLCASSVDAMLKEKGLKKGKLYSRIEEAVAQGIITKEMSAWAHDIRLDANDERHADEDADLPTMQDAEKCIDFVKALADFMFILPAKVERGRNTK